jgi:hypothetical protein
MLISSITMPLSKQLSESNCSSFHSQHNFIGHQQPQKHNKQESTTFILPYGSNKQHCMDKEEFHLLFGFGVVQGWFSAKLGSKISEGSQLMSAQFPWPPAATGT